MIISINPEKDFDKIETSYLTTTRRTKPTSQHTKNGRELSHFHNLIEKHL